MNKKQLPKVKKNMKIKKRYEIKQFVEKGINKL